MKTLLLFFTGLVMATGVIISQKQKVAVLNFDVSGIPMNAVSMGNLVRLEVEKTGKYAVLDKYDLQYLSESKGIDINECFGRICLVDAGKTLGADKMLTGRVERFDDKIIVIMRLIDVASGDIESTDIMEYLDIPELQRMVRISVNNLLDIENDQIDIEMLASYEDPINTPKTQLRLNGPRMGVAFVGGQHGRILQKPEHDGGFGAYPVSTMFGYQFEASYLSAGNFQALFEFIGMVNGMEQSRFVPSVSVLNGLRSSKSGLEFAFGPLLEVTRVADGFVNKEGDFVLDYDPESSLLYKPAQQFDSRGNPTFATSWIWAVGKTFRSGYLNIPVNVYYKMQPKGYSVGLSFGFNVNRNNR